MELLSNFPKAPECPSLRREHRVVITADNLRMLCQPIRLSPWGHTASEVARKLGVHECAINVAIRRGGIFNVELSRRGRFGKLVNVLRSDRLFDASAKNFEPPDPVFGSLWPYLADMIPEDFEQLLDRVPSIQSYRPPLSQRPRRPGPRASTPWL